MTYDEKLQAFAALVEQHQIRGMHNRNVACEANIRNCKTTIKKGKKYDKVDIGYSGRFMVESATGDIFGIKAYGQIHRGHPYGNLDTTAEWDWSEYFPRKTKEVSIHALIPESLLTKSDS